MRKQVYKLTAEDLERFSVWEYALDEEGREGQDEATVRPLPVGSVIDPGAGIYIVRAIFELNDGSQMKGYLTPPLRRSDDLGMIQPVIICPGGQVGFWHGVIAPSREELASYYQLLGQKPATDVFPVHFRSDAEVLGGPVQGELAGFLFLEEEDAAGTVQ